MKKYLIVKADTNDADFITRKEEITDDQLAELQPLFEAIRNFKPYKGKDTTWNHSHDNNYPTGDCHREDLGELSAEELYGNIQGFQLFDESFCPYDEYGIHTIESVDVLVVTDEKKII